MDKAINYINISNSISRDRLEKYFDHTSPSLETAIQRYETNTRIAEAFYTSLQAFEVCLRNQIHHTMSDTYGADWITSPHTNLNPSEYDKIRQVCRDLQKRKGRLTTSDIIAEMHFGFWLALLGPQYDNTLWRQACYRAFKIEGRHPKRKRVHNRINAIRRFRNRIAHYEPISHLDVLNRHAEILETIA